MRDSKLLVLLVLTLFTMACAASRTREQRELAELMVAAAVRDDVSEIERVASAEIARQFEVLRDSDRATLDSMQTGLRVHRVARLGTDTVYLAMRFSGPRGSESADFGFVRDGMTWRCYLFALPRRM